MSIEQPLEALNERELEIIPLLAEGLSNKEIAERLFLAPSTVKWYIRQLNQKLDTATREEIVARIEEMGLMQVEQSQASYFRPRQNLPRQTTPFIGRDAELDEIHSILENPDIRLLTILAQGGMGKTRIALEATEQQSNHFPDGVYFVGLQSLSDSANIVPQIATATGFQFSGDNTAQKEQILDFLANKTILLCIDNWEHLLDAAPLVTEILLAAPNIKIIATSREKLNLMGEAVYVLQGMQFPDWESPADALEYDAVQLLLQSAKRVKPDWTVTEDNLDYVTRVCRLTQGMPLGLLLAASWLDYYSLDRICEEIQKNVDILESDMRDIPGRQRSIRAIFDYAWQHMSKQERDAFMKMTVFKGGCTARAAETITGANPRTLHNLVNKALLGRTKNGRYEIHELLRQYAETELHNSADAESTMRAHNTYYASAVEERWIAIIDGTGNFFEIMDDIESDLSNIQQAWYQSLESGDYTIVYKMGRLLPRYYLDRQQSFSFLAMAKAARARYLTGENIPQAVEARLKVAYIVYDGEIARFWIDLDERMLAIRRAEQLFRELDEQEGVVRCLYLIAIMLIFELKQYEEGLSLLNEGLELAREMGSPYYQAWNLIIQSVTWSVLKRHDKARVFCQEGLQLAREHNQQYWELLLMMILGRNLWYFSEWDASEQVLLECISLSRRVNSIRNIKGGIAFLITLLLLRARFEEAEHYLQESEQLALQLGGSENQLFHLFLLIWKHFVTGDYEAHLQSLKQFEGIAKNVTHTYIGQESVLKALALCGLEDYSRAEQLLIEGLKLHTSHNIGNLDLLIFGLSLVRAYKYEQYEQALALASLSKQLDPVRMNWEIQPLTVKFLSFLKSVLSPDVFNSAWKRGQTLDVDTVVSDLLADAGESES